jgi:hypothetical protein
MVIRVHKRPPLCPASLCWAQVDLKDKWRNLVKLVTDPNKHARGMDLSEEQRQTILRLVFANDINTTSATAGAYVFRCQCWWGVPLAGSGSLCLGRTVALLRIAAAP